MKTYIIMLSFLLSLLGCKTKAPKLVVTKNHSHNQSIHQFTMKSLDGNDIKLDKYRGKVMLVVNVASKCGLTPQYEQLEELHKQYQTKGLSILGFPANNFMSQEPGTNSEIAEFCQKNYGVSFDMFSKISVKGNEQDTMYAFLTQKQLNGSMDSKVGWNFQKYILDKNGFLVTYFPPTTKPNDPAIIAVIDSLLQLNP